MNVLSRTMKLLSKAKQFMSDEKGKNLWGSLQSIVIIFSLVIGGIWTMINFDFLMRRAQRSVNVTIKPSQVKIPGDSAKYISAIVEYTNVGKDPETFYWPEDRSMFTVTRISLDKNGALVRQEPTKREGALVTSSPDSDDGDRLLPGQVSRRVFLAKVDEPGLYYLEFLVRASEEEQKTAWKNDKVARTSSVNWQDAAYMTVE